MMSGMETTIIDSAIRGILSIPVVPRTYDLICTHFFHDNYKDLAIDYTSDNKTYELYKYVKNLNKEQYDLYSKKSMQLAQEHYSSENVSKQLSDYVRNIPYDKKKIPIIIFKMLRNITTLFKNVF